MSGCINLKERFGKKYRIRWDECREGWSQDPWMMQIPCRYGHVYPHGGDMLGVSVDGHGGIAAMIRRLGCCRVTQDGDHGELSAVFNVADFRTVAKVVHPHRKGRVTEAQKRAAADRLRVWRESSPQAVDKSQSTAQGCVPGVALV